MYDILILNGRIVSGTGNPWFYCDIGISGGTICDMGRLDGRSARRVIDAERRVVCPGFIDAHSHSDLSILAHPDSRAKIMQGVTTEVVGLDGFALAPIEERNIPVWKKYLSGVNGDPGVEWNWREFSDYLDTVDAAHPSVNIASYAGLGVIRLNVMGMTDRPATPSEISRMAAMAERAMEEGARGISAGLIYPPNQYQSAEEIASIAKAVRRYDGALNVHLRSEGDRLFEAMDEVIDIGRASGINVIITHFKVMGRGNWGRSGAALEKIDRARGEGVEVSIEQYPYTAASTTLHSVVPPWYHSGGPDELVRKLREKREAVKRDIRERTDWENWALAVGWENIVIASVAGEENQRFVGKSVEDIRRMRGLSDPADAALDILVEEEGAVTMIMFCMDERDVSAIMRHPTANIITDGILGGRPHPRVSGSFPRVLGRYVREQGVLTLDEAIRKMTSLPAEKLRLKRKGVIAEGLDADIVVFDPETVTDTATYEDPFRHPEGIQCVLVNGEIVVENGRHTGAAPGKTVRLR